MGSEVKFVAKAENETRGTDTIKYRLVITRDGKTVATKVTKGTAIDTVNKTNVLKIGWTPTKAGDYTATLTAADSTGMIATRTMQFKVYNKQLALRSIDINTDRTVAQYENVTITPHVTGGTGSYTYSYYYVKGGKTYTLLENTKKTSVKKSFPTAGAYQLLVKVKDTAGTTVQTSRYIRVEPTTISRIDFWNDFAKAGDRVTIGAKVKYACSRLTYADYTYTITKEGGTTQTFKPDNSGMIRWVPTENGTYTVTLTIQFKGKTLAAKSDTYEVGAIDAYTGMTKINVNVISYVYNELPIASYQVHYWGGKSGVGDVTCTPLSTTVVKNVGFWDSAQTFRQYTAYIPKDATGFKFHIGDRWFPEGISEGDGSTATQNTVYIFNYDHDRCLYTKE